MLFTLGSFSAVIKLYEFIIRTVPCLIVWFPIKHISRIGVGAKKYLSAVSLIKQENTSTGDAAQIPLDISAKSLFFLSDVMVVQHIVMCLSVKVRVPSVPRVPFIPKVENGQICQQNCSLITCFPNYN